MCLHLLMEDQISRRLPQEVCESVIEAAAEDAPRHTRTLYSCALVCRSWVPTARNHLFRDVYLRSNQQALKYMASILASPRLGGYLNKLAVNLRYKHTDWIYKFGQVLPPYLPNLRHLEYLRFPTLHPLFFIFASRFTSIRSLTLLHFESQSFREIVRLVKCHQNLETLSIWDCRWKSPGSPFMKYHSSLAAIHFDEISRECGDDIFRWMAKDNLPILQHLSVTVSLPTQSVDLDDLLGIHSTGWVTLNLSITIDKDSDLESLRMFLTLTPEEVSDSLFDRPAGIPVMHGFAEHTDNFILTFRGISRVVYKHTSLQSTYLPPHRLPVLSRKRS